jgi:hypothetical protein
MHARRNLRIVAMAALLLMLAGCAKMNAALGKQWVEVSFSANTSVAAELQIRAACSHVPNTRPEALPPQRSWNVMMNAVRYDVTTASDANVAALDECLSKFKSVQGTTVQNVGDEGD